MKKMNRKGFTIVELVIVIAVIAILAGVLIPTFSGIVKKAQESAALQEAAAAYKEAYALALSDGKIEAETVEAGKFVFTFAADETCTVKLQAGKEFGYAFTVVDGAVNIAEGTTEAVEAAPAPHEHNWEAQTNGEGAVTGAPKCSGADCDETCTLKAAEVTGETCTVCGLTAAQHPVGE